MNSKLVLAATVAAAFTLTGCGGSDANGSAAPTPAPSTAPTTPPPTAAPSILPASTPPPKPPKPTAKPTKPLPKAAGGCCSMGTAAQKPGNSYTLNSLKVTTVAVSGETAILRLKPA